MRDIITGALVLGACMGIEASIPAAAVMILASLTLQGGRHGKTTRHTR